MRGRPKAEVSLPYRLHLLGVQLAVGQARRDPTKVSTTEGESKTWALIHRLPGVRFNKQPEAICL